MKIIETEADHSFMAIGTFKIIPIFIMPEALFKKLSWYRVIYPAIRRFLVAEFGKAYNRKTGSYDWTLFNYDGLEKGFTQRLWNNKNPSFIFAKWNGTDFEKIT